jgi:hypothetical protein
VDASGNVSYVNDKAHKETWFEYSQPDGDQTAKYTLIGLDGQSVLIYDKSRKIHLKLSNDNVQIATNGSQFQHMLSGYWKIVPPRLAAVYTIPPTSRNTTKKMTTDVDDDQKRPTAEITEEEEEAGITTTTRIYKIPSTTRPYQNYIIDKPTVIEADAGSNFTLYCSEKDLDNVRDYI